MAFLLEDKTVLQGSNKISPGAGQGKAEEFSNKEEQKRG
jgi:hypothetical protein